MMDNDDDDDDDDGEGDLGPHSRKRLPLLPEQHQVEEQVPSRPSHVAYTMNISLRLDENRR